MKRIIVSLTLAAAMLLCAACGSKTAQPAPQDETPQPQTETTAPQPQSAEPQNTDAEPQSGQETPTETADRTAPFADALDAVCDVLYNGWSDGNEYPLVPAGVIEAAFWNNGPGAVEQVGYALVDLNGDGTEELLLSNDGETLIGGYSIVDGEPVLFLDGWSRNIYFPLENGRFYNQGSGGAAYSIFGVYHLSADGAELICEDCYFTDLKEGSEDELLFYHNTTGEWDAAASERFDGTEDDFWNKAGELAGESRMPELTPLSAYDYTGPLNQPLDCKVRLDYEEDVSWYLPEGEAIGDYFPELAPTGDDGEIMIVFHSVAGVEQFRLLSLELRDVDAAGNAEFAVTELCALPELKADVPLTVPMTFPGDLPTSGFSYVENGVERQFSVSQSGRDGALVVSEINAK